MSKLLVAVAACLLALGLTTQAARAQDVKVCPPGTPPGETDKCPGNYGSIKEAIAGARSDEVIVIPSGTRTEAGIVINDKDLTIRGAGALSTTIQAASAPCLVEDRVFRINSARVKLQDLTIQYGCVRNATENAVGGGVWSAGSLTLERVIVRENTVKYDQAPPAAAGAHVPAEAAVTGSAPRGGGVYAVGSLEIIDSTILTNVVSSTTGQAFGGGVYNNGTAHIVNSTVSGNRATGMPGDDAALAGGGIFNADVLVMEYTTVVKNVAVSAGGGLKSTGRLTLINNLFFDNAAPVDEVDCSSLAVEADQAGAAAAPAPTVQCDTPVNGSVELGPLRSDTQIPLYIPDPNSASVDGGVCVLSAVSVDQRGSARGQGNECDLGAVELGFSYMPVLWSSPAMPDLIVRDIIVEPAGDLTGGTQATIKVVIENIGNKAATGGFYVDLFINPPQDPPNHGGYTWADLCRSTGCDEYEGIVWAAPLTIDRGEQFTFTSNLQTDPYVWRKGSQWDKYFSPGKVKLWAYVDSYEENGWWGGYIEERREDNNLFSKPAFTVLPGRIPDAVGSAAQADVDLFAPRPRP